MIKYYGGKKWLSKYLPKYLPDKNSFDKCIDLFVGGGSITEEFLKNYNNKNIIINDLDSNLMNFYNVCKNDYSTLCLLILDKKEKVTFDEAKTFRKKLEDEKDEYIKAYYYYTCIYCGYGDKPYASPTKDKFNQYKKRNTIKDLELCRDILFNCELKNKDYRDIIYNNCLYYCDPPYKNVGDNTYYGSKGNNHKNFNHLDFFNYITDISKNNKVIISYENSDEIKQMYKNWNIYEIEKKVINFNPNNKNNETLQKNELLIINY